MQEFIHTIEKYRKAIAPDIIFIPEISICRTENNDFKEYQIETVLEILKLNYFDSIDMVGDENISPVQFKELYHKCRMIGMDTKMHIGESTSYENIYQALAELEVQEIQHGISAADSPELMKLLRDKNTTLHICPTSNIMLNHTKDYTFPQLRTLIDHQVKVTINTDDLLIFDSTISEEYLKLFQSGNFSAQELDDIRLHGLSYRSK
ncbi:MAG: hypothetical protein ACERKZ_04625 [Lachnotalea sp.]